MYLVILFVNNQKNFFCVFVRMEEDDDFYGDSHEASAFVIEQRSTERLLDEIHSSGYRDAHQKFMEDEKQLQIGFDAAYVLFCRIGFLTGQIKSYAIYLNCFKHDSAFMAKLTDKLDKLARFNFENYFEWDEDMRPNLNNLKRLVASLEANFNRFKTKLISLTNQPVDIEGNNIDLSDLNMDFQIPSDDLDAELPEARQLQGLIENLNF